MVHRRNQDFAEENHYADHWEPQGPEEHRLSVNESESEILNVT